MARILTGDPGDETTERKVWIHPSLMEKPVKKKPLIATEEEGLRKQLESDARA